MPVRKFINDNGGIIAVVTAILAVGLWVTTSISNVQLEQSKRFEEQNKQYQQQFTEMVEKIGKIDGDARVRDKEIELLIANSK
ncbi:hypothetical protein JK628_23105 (plasmid) [Shewanella sp. KX20019]|uniref:hypothetical protein n=1 Tax=Shewanella sp. KX20019 TaxID=2803864 RepID=UPI001928036B|nr:hypothetical protein [Shewanella sp. KX20019]QQX82703.1 hypothetical protein JK628_23105 [Shewanella sp. KX20019]